MHRRGLGRQLEMQNPGGSIKDRIALSMIERAEQRGEISPERTTIVEATSGGSAARLKCAWRSHD